ncbi:MAG: biliverdin-producing heme oxygenase [Pseudomonadota bacterium]
MNDVAAHGVVGPGMRATLRAATRELHAKIEEMWTPDGGFGSRQTYLDFLYALLCVHQQLGVPAALRRGDPEDAAEEYRRIRALCNDLELPRPRSLGLNELDEGFAWGVGYVLNGSSLGATILLDRGALQPDWPTQYLSVGREYVKSGHLKRFFDSLNVVGHDPKSVQRGAFATFDQIGALRNATRREIA